MTPTETDVRYAAEYRYEHDDRWLVAGDVYGYPTIDSAREAAAKEKARPPSREFHGTRTVSVAQTRLIMIVTTSVVIE